MMLNCRSNKERRLGSRGNYHNDRSADRRSLLGIATLAGSLLLVCSAFGQGDPEFRKANDEYARGQFQEAIQDYQSLVNTGQSSAALFYNVGNAYFRGGDLGRAILSYERALALEPQHPESMANLAVAREEARALELQRSRWDGLLQHVTPNQLTITAAVAFWLSAFAIAIIIFDRRRFRIAAALTIIGCLALIVSLVALYRSETFHKTIAIITAPEVQARLATADNAKSVLQLPPGSEIRVLSKRGDWVYALLPNDLRGWVPSSSAEPVRL